MSRPRFTRAWAALAAISAACAPPPPAAPSPEQIPALEARLAARPNDARTLVTLALAYQAAERRDEARELLIRAQRAEPRAAAAPLFLALDHEARGEPDEARTAYARYLEVGRSPQLLAHARARIALLDHQALLAAASAAVAREAQLARTTPDPASIAVYPFLYAGADPALQPLELALAEMLVTDLAVSHRLRVLERTQIQHLLDELRLAESDRVDRGTAARGGRLLGAGHVVQGRIDGTEAELGLNAAVVAVGGQGPGRAGSPLTERDAARRLLDMQKRLALGILRQLNVELTPDERERFGVRHTESLEALLLFGRGLAALDGGRYAEAAELFGRATALDPDFGLARERASLADQLSAADATTPAQIAAAGMIEVPALIAPAAPLALDGVQMLVPSPTTRNPTADAFGTEGIGRAPVLEVIIRRP